MPEVAEVPEVVKSLSILGHYKVVKNCKWLNPLGTQFASWKIRNRVWEGVISRVPASSRTLPGLHLHGQGSCLCISQIFSRDGCVEAAPLLSPQTFGLIPFDSVITHLRGYSDKIRRGEAVCTKVKVWKCWFLRHVWLFAAPWTVARQPPMSMGFSRQEYWSGLPCPPPGGLPEPGIEPRSSTLWTDSLLAKPRGEPQYKGFHPKFTEE